MDQERVLTGQTVLVHGSRIVAIGAANQVKVPAQTARIDGRGKFLIPGLADMHVHLDSRFIPAGVPKQGDSVAAFERMLFLYVASGVTTVRNMNGYPVHVALRERAASGEMFPRIYTSGPQVSGDILTPGQAKAIVRSNKAARYDFIKLHSMTFSPEAFDTFVAAAKRAGIGFAGHPPNQSATATGVERMLQGRAMSIEHLHASSEFLAARDGEIDVAKMPALVAAYRQSGVWSCPTQAVQEAMLPSNAYIAHLLDLRRTLIKMFHAAGVGLLLGTDGPSWAALGTINTDVIPSSSTIVPGSEVHLELRSLVRAGLTPYQALETGTRNVAVFLNALDSTGTIAVGKRADVVLLMGNPLEDVDRTANQAGVMLGGRWLSRAAINQQMTVLGLPAAWHRE
jgi:imidazolonepropionase-like amidohydrolase